MEVYTQILLKAEFDTPLLLRLFSEADGWVYLSITRDIMYTVFLRIRENRDISSTKHIKLDTLKFIQVLQKCKHQ